MHNDIGERVRDLKQTKANLPADIYICERTKNGIARQHKQLLPAGTSNNISIVKDANGHNSTDNTNIARILTNHWQSVFDAKSTNEQLRGRWPERVRNQFKAELDELWPNDDDSAAESCIQQESQNYKNIKIKFYKIWIKQFLSNIK